MNLEILTQNHVVLTIGSVCLILILNSWMLPIIVITAILGYYSFDRFQLYLTRFFAYLSHDTNNLTFFQAVRHLVSNYIVGDRRGAPVASSSNSIAFNANSNYNAADLDHKKRAEAIFDPLLHNNASTSPKVVSTATKKQQSSSPLLNSRSDVENGAEGTLKSSRSHTNSSLASDEGATPHPHLLSPIEIPKLQLANRTKIDLKIDEELDKHIAKLFKAIFSIYISPEWAPYETRQLLRRTLRKLLLSFAERVKLTFFDCDPDQPEVITSNEKLVTFFKDKVIPIVLHHLSCSSFSSPFQEDNYADNASPTLSATKLRRLNWKVRRLSRQLLMEFMPKEDRECKLWVELGVSILGDGFLWNCILLGRDELPKIIEEALEHLLLTISTGTSNRDDSESTANKVRCKCSSNFKPSQSEHDVSECRCDQLEDSGGVNAANTRKHVPDQHIITEHIPVSSAAMSEPYPPRDINRKYVHMLLDSFLDPNLDVEQPPQIVSRWRPTLNEILIERELLYCLIQYLRGERALEYLQAVLDDSPDGSAYCRRILELEYLPQFFRSKLYMECLGMKLEEMGVEAGSSESLLKPGGSKFKKSSAKHSRTGSGSSGISSSIFKSTGIVDGLAIPPSAMPADGSGYSSSANSEADPPKKRRQHILQPFIKKFFESATSFGKLVDPKLPKLKVQRLGTDAKSYEEMNHPDVFSSVSIQPCDIYTCSMEIGASWVNRASWLESVIIGWGQLFRPILKPKFDKRLDEKLQELLTLDTFIEIVDLITRTFVASQSVPSDSDEHEDSSYQNKLNLESPPHTFNFNLMKDQDPSLTFTSKLGQIFTRWMILNAFDYPQIVTSIHANKDEFVLFFVDVLDVLVRELTTNSK